MKAINKILLLSGITIVAVATIIMLYRISENIVQYDNKFVRRFPHFTAVKSTEINLSYNSFYFAGNYKGKIYLGNNSAPLLVIETDTLMKKISKRYIKLNRKKMSYSAVNLKIINNHFFLTDGNIPFVFKGKTTNWEAKYILKGKTNFTKAEPIDSVNIILNTINKKAVSVLGLINLNDTSQIHLAPQLLEKQADGFLDTDGMLSYNPFLKKVVYQYRYRNSYLIIDTNLEKHKTGNTIDTITKPQLNIKYIKSHDEIKFAKKPTVVNYTNAMYQNLLFVNSQLPGKYEPLEVWKQASIVDVYNINDNSYICSFYIYNENGKKMKSFSVIKENLVALIDNKIVKYKLKKVITKHYNKQ